jgi:hypothetical protein
MANIHKGNHKIKWKEINLFYHKFVKFNFYIRPIITN